ncbi:hypothetical protein BOTBODRAFT_211054 [Botryobasidium botryosum FD-172 SS1]|uniref:C2H2-type domain-containing protein n=1 Tax=Botryobasidium botryosum (strain FD-172 SS1) TaxID=930990 RepID=A0A067N3Z1_BOTB1|nr:hypothetical protein BOTBODRAFT_211054 [Botryobasidium botryosum FD-172 SS1]
MDTENAQLFTCISCAIAYPTAQEQREHYRSDHHRYNMKRKVANLPPVSAAVFNQKVLERRAETAITTSPKGSTCEVCHKVYTTENAYRSHINSKKHKENELRAITQPKNAALSEPAMADQAPEASASTQEPSSSSKPEISQSADVDMDEGAIEEEVVATLEERIASARSRIGIAKCLFCSFASTALEDNLTHMSQSHGFFIPDAEYLVDLPGLITYLGEKIAVNNICLYCNGRGREFHSLEAVQKHMVDKSHCKLAYDTEKDRLGISDYYDFSSSYPDALERNGRKLLKARKAAKPVVEDEEWEEMEDDGEEADEVIEEMVEDEESEDEYESDEDDYPPDTQLTYGDSPFELVLPSGARIGHRSMRRYYAQSFSPLPSRAEDPNSGAGLVRRLISDRNSALVPSKGGFGAFGGGTSVVKARNPGEAKEAGRHIREFRDQNRREQFKTKVGYRHNSQKHFRDPLLQ